MMKLLETSTFVVLLLVALSAMLLGSMITFNWFSSPHRYSAGQLVLPATRPDFSTDLRFTAYGQVKFGAPGKAAQCSGTLFSQSEMNAVENHNLVNAMSTTFWPSFKSHVSDMSFWEFQYNKHGRCSDQNFNQTEYFNLAWGLWRNYNADEIFYAAGIVPGKSYPYADLERAIQQRITQHKPVILCKSIGGSHNLLEVIICFDDKGKNVVNCPRTSGCENSTVKYAL